MPPIDHPDEFAFAIILSPYGINELVRTHYALVEATAGRTLPGRVLYTANASPYRGAIAASFGARPVLEIVADPFPSPPRKRVLVVDDDPVTAKRIASLPGVEVIHVDDGWNAVDRLTKGDVDLAVCAVSVGGFSGAKIHKLVATARPEMARRIVFVASEGAVSQAPPSTASGRVLTRPVEASAVASLLEVLSS